MQKKYDTKKILGLMTCSFLLIALSAVAFYWFYGNHSFQNYKEDAMRRVVKQKDYKDSFGSTEHQDTLIRLQDQDKENTAL